MGKKLKSALFHFTRETNQVGNIGSRKEMYICNYCKWKTVINVTRMFDHLFKKCSKCPPIVTQTSGLSQYSKHVRRNSDSDSDSVNITTSSSVQKKVPMSIMQFVDSINDNEQIEIDQHFANISCSEYCVKFMKKKPSTNSFLFPLIEETSPITVDEIKCVLSTPTIGRRELYTFSDDLSKFQNLY